jgi:hypothetical protein
MSDEENKPQAYEDVGLDVVAHNALFSAVGMYGRMLAEKDKQIAKLNHRLRLAYDENLSLRGQLRKHELQSNHDRQNGEGLAGSQREGATPQQG